MRTRITAAGATLALLLAAAAPAAEAWKKYTSKESGFSVVVPGTPKYEKKRADSAAGPLTLHNFTVSQANDTIAYMVNRTDYPASLAEDSTPDKLLDLARDGQMNSLQARIRSERKFKLSGYPARELLFDSPRGLSGHVRLVMAKNRLYQVLGLATTARAKTAQLGRFVKSFALLPAR